jgi:serine/threonine protein kinase
LELFYAQHDHLSLGTKLWLLVQIANGLRFLLANEIYHLDVKPGNVLLSRNFICKLIDFGESYVKGVSDPATRPGKTFPYAAPEVFQETIAFNDKIDVFSFGVVVCESIFEEMIVDYKKSNHSAINSKYLKNTYKTKLTDKTAYLTGPKHLMKILRFVVLFCIESDPNLRPTIEWMIYILKESLNFLDRMY